MPRILTIAIILTRMGFFIQFFYFLIWTFLYLWELKCVLTLFYRNFNLYFFTKNGLIEYKRPMDNIAHLSRRYYNIQALSKLFLKILKDTINLIFYYYLNFFWRKKKNERTWILTLKCFVQNWFNLIQRFWMKKLLKVYRIFWLFSYYLLLGKSVALVLIKLKSPLNNNASCQAWLKLSQWSWNKRGKFEKLFIVTDRITDRITDGRQVISKAQLSFQPRCLTTKRYPFHIDIDKQKF